MMIEITDLGEIAFLVAHLDKLHASVAEDLVGALHGSAPHASETLTLATDHYESS